MHTLRCWKAKFLNFIEYFIEYNIEIIEIFRVCVTMFGYKGASESKSERSLEKSSNERIQSVGCALDRPINKCVKFSLNGTHPLELKEKNYLSTKHQMDMKLLRNIQGIHAPLRISMELRANQNVGRLPFLPSSNFSADIIRGRDDCIDFTDVLYPVDMHEQLNRPYVAMERF